MFEAISQMFGKYIIFKSSSVVNWPALAYNDWASDSLADNNLLLDAKTLLQLWINHILHFKIKLLLMLYYWDSSASIISFLITANATLDLPPGK